MATITTGSGDKNRLNALQLINNVSQNLMQQDAPAGLKQLFLNKLNNSLKKFAGITDDARYLNATTTLAASSFSGTPVDAENFAYASINTHLDMTAQNPTYYAQQFVYGDSSKALTSITLSFTKNAGAVAGLYRVYILGDDGAGDYVSKPVNTDIKASSDAISLPDTAETNVSVVFTLNTNSGFVPVTGAKYWVVIEARGAEAATTLDCYCTGLSLPILLPLYLMHSSTDGIVWTQTGGGNVAYNLWFSYEMTPKVYFNEFWGPSDCNIIQRIYTNSMNLLEFPWDRYQQMNSVPSGYFTVGPYNTNGQPKIKIPGGYSIDTIYIDYKRKIQPMVYDSDVPTFPSEYIDIIELDATLDLALMGYGNQDANYIQRLEQTLVLRTDGLLRDYRSRGEMFINVTGMTFTPAYTTAIKQPNDMYPNINPNNNIIRVVTQ